MFRRLVAPLLVLLAIPAAAQATTFCVSGATGCSGMPETSIALALGAAHTGDIVRLGATTYSEDNLTMAPGVTLAGAGAGTVIKPGTGTTGLQATGAGDVVSNLTVLLPPGSARTGLALAGAASGVLVGAAQSGSPDGTGVTLSGPSSTFTSGLVLLPTATASVGVSGGGVVEASVVAAGTALRNVAVAQRLYLSANLAVDAAAGAAPTLDDDLILLKPGSGTPTGIRTAVGGTFRHLTIVGTGAPGAIGLTAVSSPTPTVRSSIFAGLATDLESGGSPIDIDYTDYNPNLVSAPVGAIHDGGHGFRGAGPGFINAAAGNYHLSADSLLIDQGEPGQAVAGEPNVDLDGQTRTVNGTGSGDGIAVSDDGAYEYQAIPFGVRLTGATKGTVGKPLTFTAFATPSSPSRTIKSYAWIFGDGKTASGAKTSHTYATPGTRLVEVVALDTGGVSGIGTMRVTIAALPKPPTPALASFKLLARGLKTARVSFSLNVAATVKISVDELLQGERVDKRCLRSIPKPPASERCTVVRKVRIFHVVAKKGKSSPFLVGGGRAALAKGRRYRARLTPEATGAKPKVVTFTAIR
jgi:PKD domain